MSEIKWELDMLLEMEHSSKDGSFYVAANYKDDVIYLEDTLYSSSTYQSDASEVDLRSHLATADAAAVLRMPISSIKRFQLIRSLQNSVSLPQCGRGIG